MTAIRDYSGWISPDEYLESELLSEIRREYVAGQVYAMSGVSVEHNRLVREINLALCSHLRGKPCEAFVNDMKARITLDGETCFYYPDILVNCDPSGQKKYYCETPSVVVEVLSPNTHRIDEREKFAAYQAIPTLQTYVLVSQEYWQVKVHRRAHGWVRETLEKANDVLRLPEIEFEMPLSDIYASVSVLAMTQPRVVE